ncbi:hypothetical protein MKW98_013235 [Papaver atlanticum]|uniref:Uncharacterized protein n=1 Tax=Papaver atlanticum TaxID=357466 RepID=A0AAD4SFL7_9MAGN|nr:hypothetical protein MKW98_013235 [Papaver atlanticum]
MEFDRVVVVWFLVTLWVLGAGDRQVVMGLPPCNFPAIYNFGDSNSDTGGISAAFLAVPPPNGETFFGRPSGRTSDGRLVIDFIAEHLGLPYLHAYLDSIRSNFEHGANFATGGSTIQPSNVSFYQSGVSPFSLDVQLWQFDQFKARSGELHRQAKNSSERKNLPKPDDFSKAIYTIDIGQNDLASGFVNPIDVVVASIPKLLDQFVMAVTKLYQQGARTFWIHNTGPIGCLPLSRVYFSGSGPGFYDRNGCVKSHNDVAVEYNRQLKERVVGLRSQLSHAALTYVDVYAAKYELISNTRKHGFVDPLKICCGIYERDPARHVGCGQKRYINGTEIYATSCGNPSMYISWDGVHYTHAANHWIANHILGGALSDPSIPITEACYKHR